MEGHWGRLWELAEVKGLAVIFFELRLGRFASGGQASAPGGGQPNAGRFGCSASSLASPVGGRGGVYGNWPIMLKELLLYFVRL